MRPSVPFIRGAELPLAAVAGVITACGLVAYVGCGIDVPGAAGADAGRFDAPVAYDGPIFTTDAGDARGQGDGGGTIPDANLADADDGGNGDACTQGHLCPTETVCRVGPTCSDCVGGANLAYCASSITCNADCSGVCDAGASIACFSCAGGSDAAATGTCTSAAACVSEPHCACSNGDPSTCPGLYQVCVTVDGGGQACLTCGELGTAGSGNCQNGLKCHPNDAPGAPRCH